MGKLTAVKVRTAKPGKYNDGDGLMLVVSRAGGKKKAGTKVTKKWVLRLQRNGRRRDFGLGSVADVSLAEAREAAEDMRRALRRGEDPLARRRKARDGIPTFREAAKMVHEEHKAGWRNEKHAAQWLSSLEAHAFPKLGNLFVDQIDGPMVRDALADIWLTIPETARRVRQRIGTVLDFAHAKGWRSSELSMRSVSKGLPKQPKLKQHLPAMRWREVPGFVANMADTLNAGEPTRLALEFLILTAARSGEVRGARWCEFDMDKKVWTIPGERMKAGRPHRVPLSDRAVAILERMKELRRTDDPGALVFEGAKNGKPLSDMTLSMPLRRAEIGVTVHGFRSSFRDWAGEATNTPREVAEACLAHTLENRVEAAYARTDHFEKRRAVMDQWAQFVAGEGGKVVPMSRTADANEG